MGPQGYRAGALLPLLCGGLACAPEPAHVESRTQAVIYGADDREELYAAEPAELRERLARGLVALVPASEVEAAGGLAAAPSLRERFELCRPLAFEDQPAVAFCSGVLVDWDLVLTAAHCATVVPLEQLRAVFGWYYRAPGELALAADSIYEVAEVVAQRLDLPDSSVRLDYAWLRLALVVDPPQQPVPIAFREALPGELLTVAGASDGLPFKLDRTATVHGTHGAPGDFFVTASDTSRGASGGPALNAGGALLGLLARGATDFSVGAGGCLEPRRRSTLDAAEEFTYAARALEGLCAAQPRSSLCSADCGEHCAASLRSERGAGCAAGRRVGSKAPLGWFALPWLLWRRRIGRCDP